MIEDILLAVYAIITVLGGGGLLYWMARNIRALQGAVQAQGITIKAQGESIKAQGEVLKRVEGLMKSRQTVLESTDEPKMLERLEAHKKFVERGGEECRFETAPSFF